jgi:hypothetical protein
VLDVREPSSCRRQRSSRLCRSARNAASPRSRVPQSRARERRRTVRGSFDVLRRLTGHSVSLGWPGNKKAAPISGRANQRSTSCSGSISVGIVPPPP